MENIVFKKVHLYYAWFFSIIIIECLISLSVLPTAIRYVSDVLNLMVFIISLLKIKTNGIAYKTIVIGIGIFLFYTLIVGLLKNGSLVNYLWGLRTFLSPLLFLINLIFVLSDTKVCNTPRFLHFLFWINLLFSIGEYLLGYVNDFNGGIFGVASGCNSGQNLLLISVLVLDVFLLSKNQISFKYFLCTIAGCLLVSILAELKVFFFEALLILVCYFFSSKFSFQKFILLVSGVIVIFAFYSISMSLNDSFSGNWDFEYITSYLFNDKGYTNSGDINRFNGISIISKEVFNNDIGSILTGVGLGMASPSGLSIVDTSFYSTYSYLHYDWFGYSYLFIESGLIGLILYVGILVFVFVLLFKNKEYRFISLCYILLSAVLLFYNNSLISFKNIVPFYLLVSIPLNETFLKEKYYDNNTQRSEMHIKRRKEVVL